MPVPEGTTRVGDYHTHGDYSVLDPVTREVVRTSDPERDDFNSDYFSSGDRASQDARTGLYPGMRFYLGTPLASGALKWFDPKSLESGVLR